MDTPDEIKENCTLNLLSYAQLRCVIFDDMHFWIVFENTWDFAKFCGLLRIYELYTCKPNFKDEVPKVKIDA